VGRKEDLESIWCVFCFLLSTKRDIWLAGRGAVDQPGSRAISDDQMRLQQITFVKEKGAAGLTIRRT
jgi:hypothetical protein